MTIVHMETTHSRDGHYIVNMIGLMLPQGLLVRALHRLDAERPLGPGCSG
jgi:hypothetical protein